MVTKVAPSTPSQPDAIGYQIYHSTRTDGLHNGRFRPPFGGLAGKAPIAEALAHLSERMPDPKSRSSAASFWKPRLALKGQYICLEET